MTENNLLYDNNFMQSEGRQLSYDEIARMTVIDSMVDVKSKNT